MIISVNWLKNFAKIDGIPIDDLCQKIGARLVEIESVENLAKKYADVIIAKVVSCVAIPDTHLHLCKIDDGGVAKNVPRDENNFVQVVCGAPNVRENLLVAWLPPDSIVPETFATDDEFKLTSRKLRGEISHGMLASPRELGLWDEHEGILEIGGTDLHPMIGANADFRGQPLNGNWGAEIKPGASFAKLFALDDYLLEVENKSLTHRPDCFGVVGFAREVAAITSVEFTPPEWFREKIDLKIDAKNLAQPTVKIADAELCNRYECVILADVDGAAQSSGHVKTFLARAGMRPISAAVDITNMLMLESGQPLHAFDYDKLCQVSPTQNPDILVRAAKTGEKLELLDSREITLDAKDIVICAGDSRKSVPIALAGAMGGKSTEIDAQTKNVLLESATFNLYNLRGTQFRHGIFSEAITRFTKGQPAELTDYVVRWAARQFTQFTGAKIASEIVDNYAKKTENPVVDWSADDVNQVLGTNYSYLEIEKTLRDLGYAIWCDCGKTDKCDCEVVHCRAPWWRTDVHIREDVVEDVGRVRGFDNISPTLPRRDFAPSAKNPLYDLQQKIRETLASFGANEILTYSFISEEMLKKAGQTPANSYKIVNSISPDLQYFRQSLTPSLLAKSYENLRAGYDNFALFELNQIAQKSDGLTDEKVPVMKNKLAFVLVRKNDENAAFYDAKNYLQKLLAKLGVAADFREIQPLSGVAKPFEPKRAAGVWSPNSDTAIGCAGEFRAAVLRNFKLPNFCAGFEISVDNLLTILPKNSVDYQPVAKYQGTARDLTLQVKRDKTFAEVENLLRENLAKLPPNFTAEISPRDIFAPDETRKNVTFHIEFTDREKTIDAKFVAKIMDEIAQAARKQLDAKTI